VIQSKILPDGMFFATFLEMKLARNIFICILFLAGIMESKGTVPFDKLIDETEVILFPNPATKGLISIQSEKEIVRIELLNIVGHRILTYRPEPSNNVRLDISNLNTGIYLIKIFFTDNTNSIKRFWVK